MHNSELESNKINKAFTCRVPFALLIMLGIKQYENRASLPSPLKGKCFVSCSKNSSKEEYFKFLDWFQRSERSNYLPLDLFLWENVKNWRGKIIGTVSYDASTYPLTKKWDEGLPYWWKLSNPKMLPQPIPCIGKLGMWSISELHEKSVYGKLLSVTQERI